MPIEDESPPIRLEYTSEFKRNLRQLVKKYKHIKNDIQPVLDTLEQGQTPGDQVPGIVNEVYKVRAQNSDSGKGKRGGYRILYLRKTDGVFVLVTIYSKTEQGDIAPPEIRQIVLDYERKSAEEEGAGLKETPTEPHADISSGSNIQTE